MTRHSGRGFKSRSVPYEVRPLNLDSEILGPRKPHQPATFSKSVELRDRDAPGGRPGSHKNTEADLEASRVRPGGIVVLNFAVIFFFFFNYKSALRE